MPRQFLRPDAGDRAFFVAHDVSRGSTTDAAGPARHLPCGL